MSGGIENRTQLQFGSSLESVSDSRPEAVKLTGFSQLAERTGGNTKSSSIIIINDEGKQQEKEQEELKRLQQISMSATDLVSNNNNKMPNYLCQSNGNVNMRNKWPWTMSNVKLDSQTQLSLNIQQKQQENLIHHQKNMEVCKINESFQVVWRSLAFEVNLSTYDKLLAKFFSPMKSKLLIATNSTTQESDELDISNEKFKKGIVQADIENNNTTLNVSKEKLKSAEISMKSLNDLVIEKNVNKRIIFKNLNGFFKSGEITAILGPSGAGKTSLLNAISGKTDNYRGKIQLIGGGTRRMRLSIIPQRDHLIENLTVRENLLYASKILNTSKEFDHEENILRVSKMLNLNNCFYSMTSNISGGEYKRVSIAQELLRQPDILILDEPTSGLDSMNCKNLIKSLAKLIENSRLGIINPMAIVMTIHQPDVEIYQMFDHIYCMGRNGAIIYDGHPKDTLNTIREQAGLLGPEIEARLSTDSCLVSNPANLLIEIASEDLYGQRPVELLSKHQRNQFSVLLKSNFNQTASYSTLQQAYLLSSLNDNNNNNNNNDIKLSQANIKNQLLNNDNISDLNDSSSGSQEFSSEIENLSVNNSFYINGINKLQDGDNKKKSSQEEQEKYRFLSRDKRLQAKIDHGGKFWHHTKLLARRAFTATIRDPLMIVVALVFHLSIPFVMSTVFSPIVGSVKGCPLIQKEFDLISMTSNNTMEVFKQLQDDVHTTFECSTMFFLTTYCFSLCSLTVAALTFPLNMHVLLKEVRNGWYNVSSFVVAKTISNWPFEVLFPVISIVMIYTLLGMPSSYLEWRMVAVAVVMALISMVSSTQGFLFGALCMDSLPTSIFMSICNTLPQVVLSGFTSRIHLMPKILQYLSWLSLYRYSSDSINIIRFGHGMCPCTEQTNEYLSSQQASFRDVPSNARPLFNYYLSNTASDLNSNSTISEQNRITGLNYDLILNTTERNKLVSLIDSNEMDVFDKMANVLSVSFSFGNNVRDCTNVRSEILIKAGTPKDEYLPYLFAGLFGILILIRVILFITVKYKIKSRI